MTITLVFWQIKLYNLWGNVCFHDDLFKWAHYNDFRSYKISNLKIAVKMQWYSVWVISLDILKYHCISVSLTIKMVIEIGSKTNQWTYLFNSISVNVHLSGLVGLVRPWWFLVMFSCTLVGCSAIFSQILYAYPAISSPGLASNVQHVPTIGNYGELWPANWAHGCSPRQVCTTLHCHELPASSNHSQPAISV